MKIAMAVLAVLMFLPAAHADGTPPSIDDVTFTAVFTSVSGATETLTGSFEYEITGSFENVVPGTGQVSGSGFLGNFTGPEDLESPGGYIAFYDLLGDEVDMYLFDVVGDSARMSLFLWGCVSEACQAAIADPGYAGNGPTSETFTISAMPEPPMLAMLFLGILPLALLSRRSHVLSTHRVFHARRN
jgi:hypothetical protein